MKITAFILLVFCMHLSARTVSQTVTLSGKDMPLSSVFKEIERQTGFLTLTSYDILEKGKPVSIEAYNMPLNDFISEILKDQSLEYTIKDKAIRIREKSPAASLKPGNTYHFIFAHPPISGVIRDTTGAPLSGATIKNKRTKKVVKTNVKGEFEIEGETGDELTVSFIGYETQNIIASERNKSVTLKVSTSKLDEVQVIAYGKTSRRLSTGNVSTVTSEEIEKQPVANPILALEGRVPGLFIEQSTGFAGTGVQVRIQGTNSMANGNEPYYVIDGIPYTAQMIDNGGNYIIGGGGTLSSPFSFLNPADIESISVLKDADATAIYGSRAANGAILITTKKAKTGKVRFDADVKNGWGKVGRRLDLMNTKQYLEMRHEALKNDGLATKYYDYDLNGTWDTTNSTDWQKELIGGTAQYQDWVGSLSGGSNNTSFLLSSTYHKEGTVFPSDFKNSKGSLHFNVNTSSANQKLRVQLSGTYLQNNDRQAGTDLTGYAMWLPPVAPKLLNSDGSINWAPDSTGATTFVQNPIGIVLAKYKSKTDNILGNMMLTYQIIPGLEFKVGLGYTRLRENKMYVEPAVSPEYQRWGVRSTRFAEADIKTWSIEPRLNYSIPVWKGKLEAMVGATVQKENRDAFGLKASGFSTDQVMEDIKSATSLTVDNSTNSVYKYNAVSGNVNYNLQDKYIVNLTVRRDGSSRFGPENRFHNFGAVGAAWIFSNEDFIKNKLSFLSFGKLRASYGTTGNDQIGDYRYLSLYSNYLSWVTAPYQGVSGYQPTNLTNPFLQWESTRKFQTGLDLSFFKERITIGANYFLNRSSNQLTGYSLPITTGFYGISTNMPATVQNSGIELTLSTTNVQTRSFSWTTNINFTAYRNKLVAFPDFENSGYASYYKIGSSINVQRFYHFMGVDPATGVFQFQTHDGKLTSTPVPNGYPDNDAIVILNPDPKFYGGFGNTFTYKGFEVDILFQFAKQIGRNYDLGRMVAGRFDYGLDNMPVWLLDRWQKPGDVAFSQRYSSNFDLLGPYGDAQYSSDVSWSDASYIRLKNLSINWSLPAPWQKAAHLQNCKLYMRGQNLLTITNYRGLDPETKSSTSLPPLKVITFGISFSL